MTANRGNTVSEQIEAILEENGIEYGVIDPGEIVVANWVRMKCTFGCPHYGTHPTCPPHVPEVETCRAFFSEYLRGYVLRLPLHLDNPEERHKKTRQMNRKLLGIEKAVFLQGHHKAFMLFVDPCNVCGDCRVSLDRGGDCSQRQSARPSPEAMAVDVFKTVRKLNMPIQVLTGKTQPMNRYAILLVE